MAGDRPSASAAATTPQRERADPARADPFKDQRSNRVMGLI